MRESGILLHITSLPSPYGIGSLGKEAHDFIDFLQKAGQRYWQVLPLNPTGYGDSPYQSCSTYAGNHYMIDLDTLIAEGLLLQEEVDQVVWARQDNRVDFGFLYENRLSVLRKAYGRFQGSAEFDRFCLESSNWLPDFALFMSLKEKQNGRPWYEWETELKLRDPDTLWTMRRELKDSIRFYSFVQFLFATQWEALHRYAHEKGISLIGDVPIYVPYDSAEVWSDPEWFQLDEDRNPIAVAGCPPDAFQKDGQLWGNPLYRWDVLAQDGYQWWMRRLEAASKWYDAIRLDHFRGFESYWAVPYGASNARGGHWEKGPGLDFIRAVQEDLPQLKFIAEDLGFLTQEVLDLRDDSGLPGMKVLGFAFDSREPSDYLPHCYPRHSVCYVGTHDNMTMRQWFETASDDAVAYAKEYMGLSEEEGLVWGVIRTGSASVSDLFLVQMQDLLNLGGEARMNFPGTMTGENWTWRAPKDFLSDDLAEKFFRMTQRYGRYHPIEKTDDAVAERKEELEA